MPRANELKRGMIIEFDGVPHAVKTIECKSPSSRGASTYYKIRYNNLQTGQKRDESHKAEDMLKEADCQRIKVQFSYLDGDDYVFMDNDDYSQHMLNKDDIAETYNFLSTQKHQFMIIETPMENKEVIHSRHPDDDLA